MRTELNMVLIFWHGALSLIIKKVEKKIKTKRFGTERRQDCQLQFQGKKNSLMWRSRENGLKVFYNRGKITEC